MREVMRGDVGVPTTGTGGSIGRLLGCAAAACALVALLAVAPAAEAAPGNPGVPGDPEIIFEEGFENVADPTVGLPLANYTGDPPTSMTYTADPVWLNTAQCNGLIGSYNSTTGTSGCSASVYNTYIRVIARGLGNAFGGGDDNQVMADVTHSAVAAPATPAATLETSNPVALPATNRFVTFSIDAGARSCQHADPLLRFFLLDGGTEIPISDDAINACTDPRGSTVSGVRVGSYASDGSLLFAGNELGVKMTNDQTNGTGNDYAVDNLRALDATPQLDKDFDSPTPRGVPTTLTFTITNTSDLAAKEGWSFTDTLPAGLTVADPAAIATDCTNGVVDATAGGTTIDVAGDLDTNQASCEATVEVVSPTPGSFENCAANISNLVGLDLPACSTLTVQPASDLAITKTDDSGDGVANVDEDLTYSLEVTNNGPDDTPSATITDTLPANVTYVSDTAGCDTTQLPVLTCEVGALANDESASVDVTVTVDQAAASSVLTNEAEVEGPNPDLVPTNNEDQVQTAVPPLSDMALTKTASVGVADPGDPVTYTIDVENLGPDNSNPTIVTDTLPPNVTYVSDTGNCDTTQLPELTCDLGAIDDGASYSFEIAVTIDQDAASTVQTNTASVEGSNPDQNPDNNTDTAAVEVPPLSDLEITKSAQPSPVRPGENLTYTLVVTNHGPTDSATTTVDDDLPAGLTLVSATPEQGTCNDSDPISCELGEVAEDQTVAIEIVATVSAQATGEIENTASVVGNNPDPNTDNNSATATTQIARADLAITKERSGGGEIFAGDQVTYTLTVTNNGPQAATGVEVTDDLPDSLTPVSATPEQGTCNDSDPLSCQLGQIPASGSVEIELVVTVGGDQADQQISNTASVEGIEEDTNPQNSIDSAEIQVAPEADLAVTKVLVDPSHTRFGQRLAYVITVANLGPNDATDVVLTDDFAAPVEIISVLPTQGTCTDTDPTECELGTIANGEQAEIFVVARAHHSGPLRNDAFASSPISDPDESNNADTARVRISPAEVDIRKVANRSKVKSGKRIRYEISVRWRAQGVVDDVTLEDVKVCDRLPKPLKLLAAPGAKVKGKRACWTVDLGPGKTRTFTVRAKAKPTSYDRRVVNRATVEGSDVATKRTKERVKVKGDAGSGGPSPCGVGRVAARC